MKLSVPQRELLKDIAASTYNELTLRGNYLRTARSLEKRGLVELLGYTMRTFGITDAGRKAIE